MGGIILIGSILVWVLSSFPRSGHDSRSYAVERERIQEGYAVRRAALIEDGQMLKARELETEMTKRVKALEADQKEAFQARSLLGRLGQVVAPVLRPLGFDWKAGVALLTGFVAKEIVVSTFGVLYHVSDEPEEENENLRAAIRKAMTPLVGYAFMVFILVYTPCLATVAAIRRETGSWKWTGFSIGYSLTLAWILAFVVYQGGTLLGIG